MSEHQFSSRPLAPDAGLRRTQARLVGSSEATRELDEQISVAARSDAKVLITGESGVGKEVTASLIHQRSRRSHRAMVAINCAGIPDTLLESELFGHVRGSFTGAHRDKPGLLEMARDGTVFLDEVGEMSLRMQALLLRFLETGEIQRVGAEGAQAHVDVRVICATNRQLEDRIAEGQFRTDLFYRLKVVHLDIPPLRERRDDLPDLIAYFAQHLAREHGRPPLSLPQDVMARLLTHGWPGNVRQLKNVIERLVIRGTAGPVSLGDLPADLLPPPQNVVLMSALQPGVACDASGATEELATRLFDQVVLGGGSFWTVVYEPFAVHDLTRATLRTVVELGLRATHGRYSELVRLFNMDARDYKRFLNALKKHECLVPFHPFRVAPRETAAEHENPDSKVA
jgi:transcriptional regulator with PAS, ATPase and Fis domain